MEKTKIIAELKNKIQNDLDKAKQTLKTTEALVQKGDLKSDGKYDTRATEANYLADGHRQRVTDLEHELILLDDVQTKAFNNSDEVQIGSLVEIELNDNSRQYFISPTAGGTLLNIENQPIMVISVFSPIGKEVLDLKVEDEFEVKINDQTRVYKINNHQ